MLKLRIKFAKYGPMKFIGHLDLMRFFQKAIRRAGIDVAYSGGYSPHQLMSFAAPLGVGLTSKAEYFDITLVSTADTRGGKGDEAKIEFAAPVTEPVSLPETRGGREIDDIRRRLAEQMVDGIKIIAVSPLPDGTGNAMASVAAAGYTVIFTEKVVLPVDWDSQFKVFLRSPEILYTKFTKKVTREINLKPLIYEAAANVENKRVYLLVDASSAASIKPQFVVEAFFDYIGQQLPEYALSICREEIYANAGTGEKAAFIPLSELG